MLSVELIGGAIVLGMALIYDTDGTIKLVTIALTVRGVTWLVKKITAGINLDASQIIDFTGWSIAGVSIVKLIGNAIGSVSTVKDWFVSAAEWVDKITFWS